MATANHDDLAGLLVVDLFRLGTEALEVRNFPRAYHFLEAAAERDPSANHLSQFGLAMAHYTGNTQGAIALCHRALKKDPSNPEHYRRLAVVYLIAGRKKDTIRILQLGLRAGRHSGISNLLQILGQRRRPVLPFLRRSNPLNKYLGKIRTNLRGAK